MFILFLICMTSVLPLSSSSSLSLSLSAMANLFFLLGSATRLDEIVLDAMPSQHLLPPRRPHIDPVVPPLQYKLARADAGCVSSSGKAEDLFEQSKVQVSKGQGAEAGQWHFAPGRLERLKTAGKRYFLFSQNIFPFFSLEQCSM